MMALVVALALAAPAAAAPVAPTKEWVIDPPAGWREEAELTRQTIDKLNTGMAKQGAYRPTQMDATVWEFGDDGSRLFGMWYVMELADHIEDQIDAFDGGVLKSFAGSAKQTAQPPRVEGSQIIRDLRVEGLGGEPVRARLVRRFQPARDGLHVLVAACMSPMDGQACEGALDRAKLTVAAPVPLDYRDPTHNLAYAVGCALGLVGFLAGGVWLGRIVLRKFG
ncbi:MAG TPA: hypothetical protein VK607_13150 [Kofleriaceae bacterium]|nr:hypothetical protein [Kofleriaceae bacterium]